MADRYAKVALLVTQLLLPRYLYKRNQRQKAAAAAAFGSNFGGFGNYPPQGRGQGYNSFSDDHQARPSQSSHQTAPCTHLFPPAQALNGHSDGCATFERVTCLHACRLGATMRPQRLLAQGPPPPLGSRRRWAWLPCRSASEAISELPANLRAIHLGLKVGKTQKISKKTLQT